MRERRMLQDEEKMKRRNERRTMKNEEEMK